MTDIAQLDADLLRDEGERLKPYTDSAGKISISRGVNLSDGISQAESDMLYSGRRDAAVAEAAHVMPWLADCPEPVQRGVTNMLYNMGWPRLQGFRKMLAALQAGEWETAATEAENSVWASQVGSRANRIAALFRGAALTS